MSTETMLMGAVGGLSAAVMALFGLFRASYKRLELKVDSYENLYFACERERHRCQEQVRVLRDRCRQVGADDSLP